MHVECWLCVFGYLGRFSTGHWAEQVGEMSCLFYILVVKDVKREEVL